MAAKRKQKAAENTAGHRRTARKSPSAAHKNVPMPKRGSASTLGARLAQWKKKMSWRQLRKRIPGWPWWTGAAVVGGTCFFLLRLLQSSPATVTADPPVGFPVHGIDISHHQGTIDWELLRNQGTIDGQPVSFAFMKATEGSDLVDGQFVRNFQEARKQGIMRGAYHFYRPTTPAKKQAEHFIRQVTLLPGDLPPVLDVEVKPGDVGTEELRQGVLEWLVRVEQHYGVKPILYTYHSFRLQYMNDSVFNLYPYWIAHYYVDSVRCQGPWAFWQHSDKGQLPGIKGDVDLDVFNGSFELLQQMTLGAGVRH